MPLSKPRKATGADIGKLVGMAERFHAAKEARFGFSAQAAQVTLSQMVGGGIVFIAPKGFIAGMVAPALTNQSVLTAYEVLWWSEGSEGRALRLAFEDEARARGCSYVNFSHPPDEQTVNKILRRAGYEPGPVSMERAL